MYEHRHERLLPRKKFAARVLGHVSMAFLATALSLFAGAAGYHVLARLPWVDSFLNAAMILGGMGPVDTLTDPSAKLFAAAYALFSGLFFIGILGIILAPFVHRVLHKLHLDIAERD